MDTKAILSEIEAERERARGIWSDLDQTNTPDDFILYSLAYLGRATAARRNADIDRKEMLVKAAGLLVAAIEAL